MWPRSTSPRVAPDGKRHDPPYSVGPMSVAPHLVSDLGYDPKRDIAPITMGVVFPT